MLKKTKLLHFISLFFCFVLLYFTLQRIGMVHLYVVDFYNTMHSIQETIILMEKLFIYFTL